MDRTEAYEVARPGRPGTSMPRSPDPKTQAIAGVRAPDRGGGTPLKTTGQNG